MAAMDASAIKEIIQWLMEGARSAPSPTAFLKEMCERLVAAGIPLWRAAAFVRTLHPDTYGRAFIWRQGGEVTVNAADLDIEETPEFIRSPVALVQSSERELRCRMDDPESHRFPFFDDMRKEGVTDYIALPLIFTDGGPCIELDHQGSRRLHRGASGRAAPGRAALCANRRDLCDAPHRHGAARHVCRQ
jgi:adenylate cyclase